MTSANTSTTSATTHFATCPLCEATCGLEITTRGREVVSIRGDADDVFSRGYLCPKAYSLKELDADPEIRVAVLTGAGGAFCAGADLQAMTAAPPGDSFGNPGMDPSVIDAVLTGLRPAKPASGDRRCDLDFPRVRPCPARTSSKFPTASGSR